MSALTWQTFRDTDFAPLDEVASVWERRIRASTEEYGAVIFDDNPVLQADSGEYEGEGADATREYFRRTFDRFVEDLESAERIKNLLYDGAEWFEGKRQELSDLLAEGGLYILPTGGVGEERFEVSGAQVLDDPVAAGGVPPERRLELEGMVERAEALTEQFRSLMAEVREYDDELSAQLKAIDDDVPQLEPKLSDPRYDDWAADQLLEQHQDFLDRAESGEVSPEEVNEWWNSLSDEERELFTTEHPSVVGPLDGVPVEYRDRANRELLDDEITDLDSQIQDLEAQAEEARGDPGADPSWSTIMGELETLQERHEGLTDLQDRIGEDYKIEDGPSFPYYLIDLDPTGDGQAVVSVGNPDTADNVNVYVPGTGADLNGIGGDIGRAEAMAADAYWSDSSSMTASMMWLGYDAPDTVGDAALESYAEGAAGDLSRFTDGLRSTAEGDPANLTMTGHSYGSTTIGVTAREEGLDVDNMIFVGSPGVGVDSAEDLGIGADNVWASLNDEDIISWARPESFQAGGDYDQMIHGTDPTSDEFGGNEFHSEATRDGAKANHSAYWDEENNIGRRNMAKIITGNTGSVT
ncbi:alpha/beta hydrolase [Glycomyces tenuis]|uniref:alpha/beta hydrolase n=1 Tax=Glycomyces tenuis TaxID=58116 RepID=UPI00040EB80D|nr:alpha/beta hydrolase [Glycomyces tenuis]